MYVPLLALSTLLLPATALPWDASDIANAATGPTDILTPWCSVDTSTSAVTDWASTPAWQSSMLDCLNLMNSTSWDGNLCHPTYPSASTDADPMPDFGFWKSHARNFHDAQDCYNMCVGCLVKGIQKGLAVTTSCHYAAYTVGHLKATCEMGFDYHERGT